MWFFTFPFLVHVTVFRLFFFGACAVWNVLGPQWTVYAYVFFVLVLILRPCLYYQMLGPLGDHHTFPSSRIRPDTSTAACNGFGPNHAPLSQGAAQATFLSSSSSSDKDTDTWSSFEQYFLKVLAKVNATIELNEQRLAKQDAREKVKLEWQHVARIIDRVLLTIFVVVTLTTTLAIMFQAEWYKTRDLLEVSNFWLRASGPDFNRKQKKTYGKLEVKMHFS